MGIFIDGGHRPFEPQNKVVFATGPLAGTGAPCNGRTAITTLWPTCWPKPLVASGHMGGHVEERSRTDLLENGYPKHHSSEDSGQCGVIINTQSNRDAQCHSHTNFTRNGLLIEVQKRLAVEIWGASDAVDPAMAYTPMNIYKARMAQWSLLRKELHDSLALCNWMGPWVASPLKDRKFGLESVAKQLKKKDLAT